MTPRLLANENFPQPSVIVLRDAGYDVFAVAESTPQATDEEVLKAATTEQRWILTFDQDYGDLIYARGLQSPPSLILFRLISYRPEHPGQLLLRLLEEHHTLHGSFVVIEPGRLRKRPLPAFDP